MSKSKKLLRCIKNDGFGAIIQVGKVYEMVREVSKDGRIHILVGEKRFSVPMSYFEVEEE